jgi:hypothetical protein
VKLYECRFKFDNGNQINHLVKYVFANNKENAKTYLKHFMEQRNDDFVSNIVINEIKVYEGLVL